MGGDRGQWLISGVQLQVSGVTVGRGGQNTALPARAKIIQTRCSDTVSVAASRNWRGR